MASTARSPRVPIRAFFEIGLRLFQRPSSTWLRPRTRRSLLRNRGTTHGGAIGFFPVSGRATRLCRYQGDNCHEPSRTQGRFGRRETRASRRCVLQCKRQNHLLQG